MSMRPLRAVRFTRGPFSGRGSVLGPNTSRRNRWWDLFLECGHTVNDPRWLAWHKLEVARQLGFLADAEAAADAAMRRYCIDLWLAAPRRPDVRALCRENVSLDGAQPEP